MEIEHQIIKGCVDGKREFQKKLYDLLAPKMLFICYRYCKNRDHAEDILQDGFIKVFKNIQQYKFQGSFEGWVRKIMVNTAIDFISKEKQKHLFDDIDEVTHHPESDADTLGRINEKDLLKLLHLLPDGYRTVFNLYVIEGYSHQEISAMLNVSEGTSKSQLSKAKAYLKKLLHQYFDVEIESKNHQYE